MVAVLLVLDFYKSLYHFPGAIVAFMQPDVLVSHFFMFLYKSLVVDCSNEYFIPYSTDFFFLSGVSEHDHLQGLPLSVDPCRSHSCSSKLYSCLA